MKIFDFVCKKEREHEIKKSLVEKDFGFIPFFNFVHSELRSNGIEIHNNGISVFDMRVSNLDELNNAWNSVYKKHIKYFNS